MTRETTDSIKNLAVLYNQIQQLPFDSLLRLKLFDEYFSAYENLRKDLPDYEQFEIDEMIFEEAYKLRL